MFRTIAPATRSVAGCVAASVVASMAACIVAPPRRHGDDPAPMLIGPVTSSNTRFENDMFSNLDPGSQRILIGQPNTCRIRQFVTTMFSAIPPPKRNTDHRVLNEQLLTM